MPQHHNPDILEHADAVRQKTSSLHGKALERVETANRARRRATQLRSAVSATWRKTLNLGIVRFLKVDLDVGLTFAQIALRSHSDHHTRARNLANARKAHDTVVHWEKKLEISQPDALEIHAKLKKLTSTLQKLGERL